MLSFFKGRYKYAQFRAMYLALSHGLVSMHEIVDCAHIDSCKDCIYKVVCEDLEQTIDHVRTLMHETDEP